MDRNMETKKKYATPDDVISIATTFPEEFEIVDWREAALPQEDLGDIAAWLTPTDYHAKSGELNRHLSSQAPGTGVWICDTDRYRQWHDSDGHSSLWIKGVPGAGKSVIAASIIGHLAKTDPDAVVLFFFFRRIVHANCHSRSLVKDWLSQLLPHSVTLQATLSQLVRTPLADVSDHVLWECLLRGLLSVGKVYCIADALDEMETSEDDAFFRRLNELAALRPGSVKLIMTSRPQQNLQSNLRAPSTVHISLEVERVNQDIHSFILHKLHQAIPHHGLVIRRAELAQAITARSAGLFLYARLLLDQILPAIGHDQEVDIDKLPAGLGDMYDSTLHHLSSKLEKGVDIQAFLLGCATQACRPLRLLELASLLSAYLQSEMTPSSAKLLVKRSCGPLLEVLDDETVQVIHHSFTEFLFTARKQTGAADMARYFPLIEPGAVHKQLAMLCMGVVVSDWVPPPERWRKTTRHPLHSYAKNFWAKHVGAALEPPDQELYTAIAQFCRQSPGPPLPLEEWAAVTSTGSEHSRPPPCRRNSVAVSSPCLGALHLAAYLGVVGFAQYVIRSELPNEPKLITTNPHLDNETPQRPGYEEAPHAWSCLPLWWACLQGHVDMVAYLLPLTDSTALKGGLDGLQKFEGPSLIEVAVTRRHVAVLQVLLQAGVGPPDFGNPATVGSMDRVAQQYDVPCLTSTLPYLEDRVVEQLLCVFSQRGNADAVRTILETTKANPNATMAGRTALYLACWAHHINRDRIVESPGYKIGLHRGSLECVRLLLDAGASIPSLTNVDSKPQSIYARGTNLFEEKGRTALHGLVSAWNDDTHEIAEMIFHVLIEAGADVEAKDSLGDTPLLTLFPRNHAQRRVKKPLAALLENGADVSILDSDGQNVLLRVLKYHRCPRLVEILIGHNVDVNASSPARRSGVLSETVSPLGALFEDPEWFYQVENGAFDGQNRRQKAVDFIGENREITRLLVNKGAHIDASGSDASLLKALPICDVETLEMLLKSVEDDRIVSNVLFGLQKRYVPTLSNRPLGDMVAALVAAGASLEARDHRGLTPLLASVDKPDMFQALLDAGADRSAKDPIGYGPLHVFVSRRYDGFQKIVPSVDKFQRLVELGFDPLVVDQDGNTLLHLAVCLEDARPSLMGSKEDGQSVLSLLHQLLDYGIAPQSQNAAGLTPLHFLAANLGESNIVSKSRAKDGSQPYTVGQLVKLLQATAQGIDINMPDYDGLTALLIAAMNTSPYAIELLDVLIAHGADMAATTNSESNALHLACIARNTSVIPYLLDRADANLINQADSRGRTPVFCACASGILESVGMLLDAGAEVNIEDKSGKTPLHACAEFVHEQRRWEMAFQIERKGDMAIQPGFDRYRPFVATPYEAQSGEKRPYENGRKQLRLSGDGTDDDCFRSVFIENPTEAVYSVVKRMILAGAQNKATEKFKLTPADYAWNLQCLGMMSAMVDSRQTSSGVDRAVQFSFLSLGAGISAVTTNAEMREEVLETPVRYLSHFNAEAIDWLVKNNANLSRLFNDQRHNSLQMSGNREKQPRQELSFIYNVALFGMTSFMERLGRLVCSYDSPENKPDQWSMKLSANFADDYDRVDETWTLKQLARKYCLKIKPALYKACERACPNMEMLKTIVDKCEADVNSRAIQPASYSSNRDSMGAVTALGYMALKQDYWHLNAIRFLVSRGADVNVRDVQDETPLIISCHPGVRRERRWAPLFFKLMLELGADATIPNEKGETCVDLVTDGLFLDLLVAAGVDVSSRRDNLLYTAVQNLDVALLQRALELGADVNAPNKKYRWSDRGYLKTPNHGDTYPIVGAFIQGVDGTLKKQDSPAIRAKRSAMIRFMIEHGADMFVPLKDGEPFLHTLFSEIVLEDSNLDLLFEYQHLIDFETRNFAGRTVLLAACDFKDIRDLNSGRVHDGSNIHTRLLDLGVNTSVVDNSGMNALHVMLDNPHMPTARIIEFLARPDSASLIHARDGQGLTPLHRALLVLRPEICDLLLDRGADPTAATFLDGASTPLHHIASQCLAHFLARPGGPLTHLRGACTAPDYTDRCLGLWRRFVDAGVSVDAGAEPPLFPYLRQRQPARPDGSVIGPVGGIPDITGLSAEEKRAQGEALLAHFPLLFGDADVARQNDGGETALHVVAGLPHLLFDKEVFQYLVEKRGLDVLAEDNRGRSSLDVAAESEKGLILEMFQRG